MGIEEARQLAAQAWCKESTRSKVMDPALAEEFAKILVKQSNQTAHVECPDCKALLRVEVKFVEHR